MKIIISALYNRSVFLEADSQVKSGNALSLIEKQVLQQCSLWEMVKYKKLEIRLKGKSVPPIPFLTLTNSLVNTISDSQAPLM